jgi:N-dimethylarginine dimethylaminohydrolase
MFTRAIVRPPADTFANGLTSSNLGPPDVKKAREQHRSYRQALERAGLRVTELEESRSFPDATFVEDVAVLTGSAAMLTRPGAQSRRGEVDLIRNALTRCNFSLAEITAPGTLDGGDVCDADGHFLIGLSARTNEEGAEQLARWLSVNGRTSTIVDARGIDALLHFKSGFAYVGDGKMVWQTIRYFEGTEWCPSLPKKRMGRIAFTSTTECSCPQAIRCSRGHSAILATTLRSSTSPSFKKWMAGLAVFPCVSERVREMGVTAHLLEPHTSRRYSDSRDRSRA